MEIVRIEVDALPGTVIADFVRDMVQLAKTHQAIVTGQFNGIPLQATHNSTEAELLEFVNSMIFYGQTARSNSNV